MLPPPWPCGKASASKAADLGSIPAFTVRCVCVYVCVCVRVCVCVCVWVCFGGFFFGGGAAGGGGGGSGVIPVAQTLVLPWLPCQAPVL